MIDDSKSMNCDRGPVQENEGKVKKEKLSQPLEETRLEQSLEWNLGALAFLSLFPYGQEHKTSNKTIRDKLKRNRMVC